MYNLNPIGDYVLVQPDEVTERIKGGLILPDKWTEPATQGIVIACGSGKIDQDGNRRELTVKPGDRIIFGKYAGAEVDCLENKKSLLLMREDGIIAIMEVSA